MFLASVKQSSKPCAPSSCQSRGNGVVVSEPVVRIVLSLESPQSLQAPRLVAVHGLQRLVTKSVVDVRCWQTLRLAGVP